MTSPRKAGGPAAPQGEAAPDPRVKLSADGFKLFKHTQLTGPYVLRSDIERARYNPRMMDSGSRKRLRDGLKRYGLVNRLVWNRRNGVLVGGHQRLDGMDRLQGYPKDCPDYLVPVDIVDVDDTRERELNVILNNASVQGTYDTAALEQLFTQDGVNPFAAGFEKMELEFMFGGDLAGQLAQTFGMSDSDTDEDAPDTSRDGVGDPEAMQREAEKIKALKERRKVQLATDQGEDSPDHVLHVVYPNARALESALKSYGMNPTERYVTAERYRDALEAELTGDEL